MLVCNIWMCQQVVLVHVQHWKFLLNLYTDDRSQLVPTEIKWMKIELLQILRITTHLI